jgi:hypothetical protein
MARLLLSQLVATGAFPLPPATGHRLQRPLMGWVWEGTLSRGGGFFGLEHSVLSLNQRGGARRAQMAATAARVKLVHWVVKRSLAETSSLLSTLCDLSPA